MYWEKYQREDLYGHVSKEQKLMDWRCTEIWWIALISYLFIGIKRASPVTK